MVQLPAENSILAAAVRRAADEHRLSHAVILTGRGDLTAAARMHKAVTVMMLKLEAQVIARNPDFDLQGRDFLNHIDFAAGTVDYFGTTYPLLDCGFPTVTYFNRLFLRQFGKSPTAYRREE